MILNDTDLLSRLRLLLHHLSWASPAPFLNVPGKPTSFKSDDISVRYNGLGQVVITSEPSVTEQVRAELIRRGWVHAFNGQRSFFVSVHRTLRQPLAQPAIASGNPLGPNPGPEGISDNGPPSWRIGRSVITEFPPRPKSDGQGPSSP